MPQVVIALGSNLGDSLRRIGRAIELIAPLTTRLRWSHVYRSEPMYVADQPSFLNAVATGHTDLGPRALLKALKGIECEMGRQTRIRNGPREIDIDLVVYGSLIYEFSRSEGDGLVIPHPRLAERRFVLEPMAEVAPDLTIPGLPRVDHLLQASAIQGQALERYGDAPVSL